MKKDKTFLIVNADDFGLSPGISDGIVRCISDGIVSSTSVIVESRYLSDSKKKILLYPSFDWGLHVVIPTEKVFSPQLIESESIRQLNIFNKNFGFMPSHIDYHRGFKFDSRTFFSVSMLALKYKIAFRYDRQHLIESSFFGMLNGKNNFSNVSVDKLLEIIENLKPGITELICHPGFTGNHLTDIYRLPRKVEVESLTNLEVIKQLKIKGINLINFREYKKLASNLI